MKGKYSKESALTLLTQRQTLLREAGEMRCPCRSDFSDEEVVAIKAFLGPWPRALEEAGLKPVSHPEREKRRKERRIQAKRRATAAKKAAKSLTDERL